MYDECGSGVATILWLFQSKLPPITYYFESFMSVTFSKVGTDAGRVPIKSYTYK
jgi:hypothetical protein